MEELRVINNRRFPFESATLFRNYPKLNKTFKRELLQTRKFAFELHQSASLRFTGEY